MSESEEDVPRDPGRRRWDWPTVVTLIASLLALSGVLFNTAVTLDAAEDREKEQADIQARGAARVLMGEFFIAAHDMRDLGGEGRLRRMAPEYPVATPPGDLRLMASRLTAREWNHVTIALSSVANLDRLMRQRIARRGGVILPAHIIEAISGDLENTCDAQEALRRLAEYRSVACPTLTVGP